MSQDISTLLKYSELAQAAYGIFNGNETSEQLSIKLRKEEVGFTNEQAKSFIEKKYTVQSTSGQKSDGFSATLFSGNDGLVLGIAGTDDGADLVNDAQLFFSRVADQFESMVSYIEQLKSEDKIGIDKKIHVVGHSLGGALTQMLVATFLVTPSRHILSEV